jgi:hypothetical protein
MDGGLLAIGASRQGLQAGEDQRGVVVAGTAAEVVQEVGPGLVLVRGKP